MNGTPNLLSATTMLGDNVLNAEGENLGEIEEFMIDLDDGRVAYAVLSFGGFLGLGDKLFAIPWEALIVDTDQEAFVLDIEKEELENAPGFDKDHWPQAPENDWLVEVYTYYGYEPYWQ
jgi:sporulation protein YlmC with PRC-barrel domain